MAKSQLGKKDIFAPVQVEKKKARQPEKRTGRQPEKERSRQVEKWRQGKRQISLWLTEDLVEQMKIKAHRGRKRLSQIVQETLERHI